MRLALRKLFLSLAVSVASHGAVAVQDTASFTTLIKMPLTIEGLTNDPAGNLYAPGSATDFFNIPTNRVVELGTRVEI